MKSWGWVLVFKCAEWNKSALVHWPGGTCVDWSLPKSWLTGLNFRMCCIDFKISILIKNMFFGLNAMI